jgi:molybdopterin-containing oxidoreductase family iron-sulfur binding subunit
MNNNKDLINLNDDLEPKIPMEFKEGVTDDFSVEELSPVSRRKFMALVGASTAFAAVSCSDYRDKKEVVPYNKKPEEVTLGRPNFYASTCTACALNCGILIKTREGRPIKVDGNPDHPISLGKTCSIGQANILNLYDPSRIKSPIKINKSDEFFLFKKDVIEEKWNVIDKEITDLLKKATSENKEIAIISEPITSPTAFRLFEDFKVKYPTVKFYFIDLFDENNKKNAWVKSFGDIPMSPLNYKDAKIIVTLEADVLGRECNFLENSGEIISNRNAEKHEEFNRIYAVEAGMSLTGMNSDYRIRLNPAQQLAFVLSLVNELGLQKKAFNLPGNVENGVKGYSLDKFAADNKVDLKTLKNLAFDLAKNKGKSILVAGKSLPEEVHIAVNMLNSLLDNKSIYKSSTFVNYYPKSSKSEFESLISKMNSKQIGVLIQFDANPAYLLSSEYGYEAASKNVDNIISLTESQNESSRLSSYVLPINHNFEAWGDYQTRTGSISLQQPVIAPINNTRQKEAVLLNWMQEKPEEYK